MLSVHIVSRKTAEKSSTNPKKIVQPPAEHILQKSPNIIKS